METIFIRISCFYYPTIVHYRTLSYTMLHYRTLFYTIVHSPTLSRYVPFDYFGEKG